MRKTLVTAALADIHANRWALEAVLADIAKRRVDQVVNLGDTLYGPLDPAGTFELLQQQGIQHIAGNMDRYVVEAKSAAAPTIPLSNHTMRFVVENLPQAAHDWLAKLPRVAEAEGGFLLCHGTPLADDMPLMEQITPQGVVLNPAASIIATLPVASVPNVLCAHTHVARHMWLTSHRSVINPGSVGLPAYADEAPFPHKMESLSPHAKYCLVTTDGVEVVNVEFVQVKYDWEQAAQQAEALQRPDWAAAIRTGRAC